jgi:hypothetical protein
MPGMAWLNGPLVWAIDELPRVGFEPLKEAARALIRSGWQARASARRGQRSFG